MQRPLRPSAAGRWAERVGPDLVASVQLGAAIKSCLGKTEADHEELTAAIDACGQVELPVSGQRRGRRLVSQLPLHRSDPFDRILTAQSLTEPLRLLTADADLAPYGALWCWRRYWLKAYPQPGCVRLQKPLSASCETWPSTVTPTSGAPGSHPTLGGLRILGRQLGRLRHLSQSTGLVPGERPATVLAHHSGAPSGCRAPNLPAHWLTNRASEVGCLRIRSALGAAPADSQT